MSFPRYPKYKASGTEVLDGLPEHWKVTQLRHAVASIESGGTPESGNDAYWASDDDADACYWVNIADMTRRDPVFETERQLTRAGRESRRLAVFGPGTLLYSIYASIGKVAVLGVPAAINQAILAISPDPKHLDGAYLKFWLRSLESCLEQFASSNTQDNLNAAKVRAFPLALPPLLEQRAIAAFLDRETAKIDALVAEQERLIELLAEKRQAVISHAVTKGLDPTAPMKPSGIEWLGDVPAHWEVKLLSRLNCTVQTGPFGSQLHADEYVEGGIPVVNPVNMVDGRIEPDQSTTVTATTVDRLAHQRLSKGDVVFSRRGELGRCALVGDREAGWLCGTGSMILRVKDDLYEPSYLARYLALELTRGYFASFSIGSIMDSLSTRTLLGLPMLVPPTEEQRRIVALLQHTETQFEELRQSTELALTLLRERRSALISAAVTGQIDVRDAVPVEVA